MSRFSVALLVFLPAVFLSGGLAQPALADHRAGDLIAKRVDASALTWECASARAAGSVSATLAWSGATPPRSAPRVLFFEDRDRDGAFDTNVDQRLCESVAPAFAAGIVGGGA